MAGLDTFGNVVINCVNGTVPDETTVRHLLMGKSTKLQSRFRLTYNMILNLLRVEGSKSIMVNLHISAMFEDKLFFP